MASTISFSYQLTALKYQEMSTQTQHLQNNGSNGKQNALSKLIDNPSDKDTNAQDILSLGDRGYTTINKETSLQIIQEKVQFQIQGDFSKEDIENIENKFDDMMKDYFSPDNVADRIVKFATHFFDAFSAQHQQNGESQSEINKNFEDLVRSSIDEGFKQAKDILGGLFNNNEIPNNISNVIDETYSKVQEGLKEFFDSIQKELLAPSDNNDTEKQPKISKNPTIIPNMVSEE